ncbi:hypothetical protein C2S52_014431 [Perilla frutescens var. hirtella]|uniref:Uncharacterized protein n=1 Tax=Perilla frutescens var. hirtella TaxID=608512 RepID=A0AAD4P9I1_PERFH|nr:hypothetical protein C2S52_014431 [Perilla frutescens var. hirtella]KAH6816709.1 hypothetical protein C2S51_021529 [Perilla frutescens var. frutescens]KAH6831969.1 hypothetical protein C2S53_019831 [Perilla frutescens var. hirtella]
MSTRRRVGEERLYYSPPAMRRRQQEQSELKSAASLPERKGSGSDSYLDRFLEHTTPVVAAQHFPRTSMRSWRNRGSEFHPYFILGDLWESFREWSVYGVGVPLLWNESDSVVQYYVPSLSGIQLYIDPTRRVVEQRRPGEESDANSSRGTSTDGESEGTDRGTSDARGSWNQKNNINHGFRRYAGRNNPSMESSVDGDDISNPPGRLIYEYFERELPFHREPLADKMSKLASLNPELKTYRSCDLTQSSWISVAWYPIYRIPVGPTLQNVDACFLTFHSLAKPVRGSEGGFDVSSKLSLPTFGLVSYKFKAADWNGDAVYDEGQKVNSLSRAADNWLRLLQVDHPDYNFFMSHNTYWR